MRRAALALLLVLATACGAGTGDASGERPPVDTDPSPFRLTWVPAGHELTMAGRGTDRPGWGDDTSGSDEPVLVLARGDDLVFVSATGYAGYQGGFDQASRGYLLAEEAEVDGRPARWTEMGLETACCVLDRHDLVVDHGDGVAIRVTSSTVDREALEDVAARARPVPGPNPVSRPAIDDLPAGFEVRAETGIDAVVALRGGFPQASSDAVPGTPASFAVGYEGPSGRLLVVSTPGGADDLAALPAMVAPNAEIEPVEVDGRPAASVTRRFEGQPAWVSRRLVTEAPGGGLFVIATEGPSGEVSSVEDLVKVAAGAEVVDEAAWAAQEVEARGGPGLHADRGAVELARGRTDGLEWLLQTLPPGAFPAEPVGDPADVPVSVDPCLRLANGSHACPTGSVSGISYSHDEPSYVLGPVPGDVASVRVVTLEAEVVVATVPLPGSDRRAFAAVLPGVDPLSMRIELLAADGALLRQAWPWS